MPRRAAALLGAVLLAGCAPRVPPLPGVAPARAWPVTALPPGHARLVFRWTYRDKVFGARGEGVARVAPPDSVRLDFFADGGLGSGSAILIGDSLRLPAGADAARYLPPVPLLWAVVGRLTVQAPDTLVRQAGDTLWADLDGGRWRAMVVGGDLRALAAIRDGRVRQRVVRDSVGVVFRHHGAGRRLALTDFRRIEDPPYDEAIWHR